MSDRFKPFLAVHLIFRKSNSLLLSRRFNTGYMDGNYSLVAGHVDEGESFIEAAIREGKEEVGVEILAKDLSLAHTIHVKSDEGKVYIAIFFEVKSWSGEIKNMEVNKCDDLSWFDEDNLPKNMVDYISFSLVKIKRGENCSVLGWE